MAGYDERMHRSGDDDIEFGKSVCWGERGRALAVVAALVALTAILGFAAQGGGWHSGQGTTGGAHGGAGPTIAAPGGGPVHFTGSLDRTAVLQGGDGLVKMELTIRGDDAKRRAQPMRTPTDVMVVLDRSGSMQGLPLEHAKAAIRSLLEELSPEDRFGLVTYSSGSEVAIPLATAAADARDRWERVIRGVAASGGTNLSSGLDRAHQVIGAANRTGRAVRIVLISDGHANEGDSSREGLVARAQRAVSAEYVLSTAGVGQGFDEGLMTHLADAGTGNFYYVRHSQELRGVFAGEFASARQELASGLAVEIATRPGVEVVDAAGYPLEQHGQRTVFRPGSLFAGQERRVWLTLRAPTEDLGERDLADLTLRYRLGGATHQLALAESPRVECVEGEADYYAAFDGDAWTRSVVKDEFEAVKQKVASALQKGDVGGARRSISDYRMRLDRANRELERPEAVRQLTIAGEVMEEAEAAFAASPAERNALAKKLVAESREARRQGSKAPTPDPADAEQ